MVSDNELALYLLLDDTDIQQKITTAEQKLDAVTKREREVRRSIDRSVRESFQLLNYVYRAYRIMLEATGKEVDEVLDAFVSVLNGAISVAIVTQTLATAETMLGNVLAIAAGFLAGVALGRAIRALTDILALRGETYAAQITADMALQASKGTGLITSFLGGGF
jgi:hypothetical protein